MVGWCVAICMVLAKRHTKAVCRGLFLCVLCCHDMPFLEKTADITMSGRHVGDMSATFPAKWMTLSRSSFTSPNPPKHRGIIVLPWNCDRAFSNGPMTLLFPSPTTAAANMTSSFLTSDFASVLINYLSCTSICWVNVLVVVVISCGAEVICFNFKDSISRSSGSRLETTARREAKRGKFV